MPAAQAARKEIVRPRARGDQPSFKRILTRGRDPENGEVWIALYNTLLHFDKEGNRRATYKVYTRKARGLKPARFWWNETGWIIGSDPLGIYEFERPDKKNLK